MTVENRDLRGTVSTQEIVDAAERLRGHIGLGPHWPLKLTVPAPVDRNMRTALSLCGIEVEIDRYCPLDKWYLRDGVKR